MWSTSYDETYALKNILFKLGEQAGFPKNQLPGIEINRDSFMVGSYHSKKNVIRLDQKLLRICKSFGKDSLNAIAFIISHEFVHCLKDHGKKRPSSFLAYDKAHHAEPEEERMADVYGLFLSYLSGYSNLEVSGELLKKIYAEYKIDQKLLKQYPSLDERVKSHEEVILRVEELIQLFHTANHLMAIDEPYYAKLCLNKLYSIHHSIEVENNLGVLHILEAIQHVKVANLDQFYLPLYIDYKSTLDKRTKARGDEPEIDALHLQKRNKLLEESIRFFEKASSRNKRYFPAILNKTCAFYYLNNFHKGRSFLEENKSAFITKDQKKIYDLLSILLDSNKEPEQRIHELQILNDLASQDQISILTKTLIQSNLDMMKGEKSSGIEIDAEMPEVLSLLFKNIQFSKSTLKANIPLTNDQKTIFAYSITGKTVQSTIIQNGIKKINLKYTDAKYMADISLNYSLDYHNFLYKDALLTNNGCLYHLPNDKVMMKIDSKGSIASIVKYAK